MATLRYGIVTYKGTPAGTLTEEPAGGTRFQYADGFGETIGCALPVARRSHDDPHGLIPFFAHLGPEGWLRQRQSAYAEIDSADDFGLLLAYGRDCVGAVGMEDPAGHPASHAPRMAASSLDRAATAVERTISGVQAKILCTDRNGLIFPAGATGPAPFIAKYPDRMLPGMIRNEATTLELCRILLGSGEVCEARVGTVEGVDGVGLIVRRFDRHGEDKLRCEDFMQVLNRRPGRDHQGKYDAAYEDLAAALRHSAAPLLDARRVFRRLTAYVLLGNVDCHMKNWSLLETPSGMRLAPVYDALNGYIYAAQGYTTRFGLEFDGERRQWDVYDRDLLLEIAARLGLGRPAAETALASLARGGDRLFSRLDQPLGLPEEQSLAYRGAVREAWRRLYG
ncbi:HipA domain-containing protein [Skermanella mucosa]|uniref:type II toxin-antitoxin system HipA family toxin n=1 Tax=Skermanella mucosa TaxID=1789672 RepID=UPI00192B3F16|nr:HipA domain-containing protein [Skermanella mucosa]UEM19593.1 HipA domain-containing protein [Skermanella mucosa]